MKKIFSLTLILLILGCYRIYAQSVPQTKYETDDYVINFPSPYVQSSQTLASSLGPLIMKIISYEPSPNLNDSNYVYMILESSYPDSTIHSDKTEMLDDFFNASINGVVQNVKGRLIKVTKGLTGKFPNRTVEVDYQNGLAIIRITMILRESKLMMIQTITNTKNYPNADIILFVNSFRLK
jgi:hypothetical protein